MAKLAVRKEALRLNPLMLNLRSKHFLTKGMKERLQSTHGIMLESV